MHVDILVVSGSEDPNTQAILAAAQRLGLTNALIAPDEQKEPAVTWDPVSGQLRIDGKAIRPRGVFLRYDHFGPGGYTPDQSKTDRAMGWFSTLSSWAFSTPDVRMFNRDHTQSTGLKGYAIHRAAANGVAIPDTVLSNVRADMEAMGPREHLIAKPAGGGAFTAELKTALDGENGCGATAPSPAIVQEKLEYPEMRVFVVGREILTFETYARTLDFRADPQSRTKLVSKDQLPEKLAMKLLNLADDLGLNFCAYDLKTRAGTGELCFLEVNSAPMFSAFDTLAKGTLSDAMLKWLIGGKNAATVAAE